MAKVRSASGLSALLGKKVLFQGRFEYGVRERLQAMAEAQQGRIVTDLDASVDYLVISDLSAGKGVQKKALSLNAKGASVQVLGTNDFVQLVQPTMEQVLSLIRGGKDNAALLAKAIGGDHSVYMQTSIAGNAGFTLDGQAGAIAAEGFDGLDLSMLELSRFSFDQCNFSGSTIEDTHFDSAKNCDFTKSRGASAAFGDVNGSRFREAMVTNADFSGSIADADFSTASLEEAEFSEGKWTHGARNNPPPLSGCVFAGARLREAKFEELSLKSPDFDQADLTGASFASCTIDGGSFRNANLRNAIFVGCKLSGANFTGADLRGANFANADLTNSRLDGADLSGANLRGAELSGVDLSKAKNYDPKAFCSGSVGPAMTELDSLMKTAKRIQLAFCVRKGNDDDGEEVSIDTSGLRYGWGLRVPDSVCTGFYRTTSVKTISDGMMHLASLLGQRQVRYETVDVSSAKSPKSGKELRDLVIRGIAEAFAQAAPAEDELAAATKAYREQVREKGSAEREKREKERAAEQKREVAAKKQISKKVAKAVGKVTDIATFLKALELRIEAPKIDKATKMLKAERFKLFNDVTDEHMSGVVKSQTDPDLVYACRIDHEGHYACCTQNLNICGGLRGSICKHLLVLIVGLVQAGELDPSTIDAWIAKTHLNKAELDKEKMGEIFIKYKGAEAGEVDWRPTETVPEDYYTL